MERTSSATCLLCGVILTATIFFQPVGACLASTEKPQPSTDLSTTTKLPSFLTKRNCTSNETYIKDCQNGADCVALINSKDKSITTECICSSKHTGKQCESRIRPVTYPTSSPIQASTIAVVVVAVVVGLVVVLVVVIVCRLRSRREQNNDRIFRERQSRNQQNGSNGAANAHGEGHESSSTRMHEDEEDLLELKKTNNNTDLLPA